MKTETLVQEMYRVAAGFKRQLAELAKLRRKIKAFEAKLKAHKGKTKLKKVAKKKK